MGICRYGWSLRTSKLFWKKRKLLLNVLEKDEEWCSWWCAIGWWLTSKFFCWLCSVSVGLYSFDFSGGCWEQIMLHVAHRGEWNNNVLGHTIGTARQESEISRPESSILLRPTGQKISTKNSCMGGTRGAHGYIWLVGYPIPLLALPVLQLNSQPLDNLVECWQYRHV